MALDKQYCIYGIDTSAFYFEDERYLEQKMYQLSNFLSVNGSNIRATTIEAIQGLYMATRWANPNEDKVAPY
jgi:hypothetical protein